MRWRHGVLIAVLMTPGAAVGDADGPARLLTYRNGRLSARLDRVPLEQVLTALSQATGAAIHGRPLALACTVKTREAASAAAPVSNTASARVAPA